MALTRRAALAAVVAPLAAPTLARPALAQEPGFPSRPLRLIIAFAPGGGTDLIARTLAQRMSTALGQPVIVENRPGGGGNTSTEVAAASRPDGYTLLMGNQGPMSVNPTLFRNLRVDPATAFDPIALVADAPLLLVGGPKLRANTMPELLTEIRAARGDLTYGSASNGSASHLSTALLLQTTGLEATHVPFRGAAPALTEVIAGNVAFMVTTLPSVMGLVAGGQLRAIATTGDARLPQLPNVPAIAETVPGYKATAWYGILVPRGVDPAIRAKLAETIFASTGDPLVASRLREEGAEPSRMDGEAFRRFIAEERTRWAAVVRAGAITVD